MAATGEGAPAAAAAAHRRLSLRPRPLEKTSFSCAAPLAPSYTRRSRSVLRPPDQRKANSSPRGSFWLFVNLFSISRAVVFFRAADRLIFRSSFFFPLSSRKTKHQVLSYDIDLLNPPAALEARKHKLKRLVQSPNSYFMDVKCQGCLQITVVFSNSQTVVVCPACSAVLCTPTGGKARLTEGCSFRKKGE